jgi:hypothetical protein
MQDAIILFGGVFLIGLPFIIIGCVISWRERHSNEEGQTI